MSDSPQKAPPQRGPARTILLVDANAEVRRYLADCAGGFGYAVLESADAEGALATLEAHPGKVDLLLTAVTLPRRSGSDLAKRARELRPGIAILYISAYPGEAAWELEHGEEELLYLSKPFTRASVDAGIRKALRLDRRVILFAGGGDGDGAFLRHSLEPAGYEVLENPLWRLTGGTMGEQRIDLLIVDLSRIGTGDEETVQRIRRANPAMKVVGLTGKFPVVSKSPAFVRRPRGGLLGGGFEDLKARWQFGADATLPKPVAVPILVETIHRLLKS